MPVSIAVGQDDAARQAKTGKHNSKDRFHEFTAKDVETFKLTSQPLKGNDCIVTKR